MWTLRSVIITRIKREIGNQNIRGSTRWQRFRIKFEGKEYWPDEAPYEMLDDEDLVDALVRVSGQNAKCY